MRESEKTIGERIRDQRLKKGFTQDYLANELHVSPQAISKWETGQTTPDITLLMPLSRVLEISVNELLGGDRRSFFEEKWQKSLAFGEEITLLVAEEALKEFPDDETFRYFASLRAEGTPPSYTSCILPYGGFAVMRTFFSFLFLPPFWATMCLSASQFPPL